MEARPPLGTSSVAWPFSCWTDSHISGQRRGETGTSPSQAPLTEDCKPQPRDPAARQALNGLDLGRGRGEAGKQRRPRWDTQDSIHSSAPQMTSLDFLLKPRTPLDPSPPGPSLHPG